jgi:hypothetical protein
MAEKRIEYRAVALDPRDDDDHYEGPIALTLPDAYIRLSDSWVVGDRDIVIESRTVIETPWTRMRLVPEEE